MVKTSWYETGMDGGLAFEFCVQFHALSICEALDLTHPIFRHRSSQFVDMSNLGRLVNKFIIGIYTSILLLHKRRSDDRSIDPFIHHKRKDTKAVNVALKTKFLLSFSMQCPKHAWAANSMMFRLPFRNATSLHSVKIIRTLKLG